MKKTLKKLVLAKETLVQLQTDSVKKVHGGNWQTTLMPWNPCDCPMEVGP